MTNISRTLFWLTSLLSVLFNKWVQLLLEFHWWLWRPLSCFQHCFLRHIWGEYVITITLLKTLFYFKVCLKLSLWWGDLQHQYCFPHDYDLVRHEIVSSRSRIKVLHCLQVIVFGLIILVFCLVGCFLFWYFLFFLLQFSNKLDSPLSLFKSVLQENFNFWRVHTCNYNFLSF